MSATDREVRSAQTAREHACPASVPGDGPDVGADPVGLADRLDAYGAALSDAARALAEELAEQAS